jgi:pentatricopeptide repeat protein
LARCFSTESADLSRPFSEPATPTSAKNRLLRQVKELIALGEVEKAEHLLLSTDLTNVEEPIRVFNRVLIAYADSKRFEKLDALFWKLSKDPKLPHPDQLSFNVYLKAQPLSTAKKWLDIMLKEGMAETTSFNILISAYCDQDMPNEATQVLERLLLCSRENPNIQPDIVSFSPIIRILGRGGLPQQAEHLFESMKDRGIEPDMIAWSSVIHAWADSRLPEGPARVAQLLTSMEESNIVPDAAVYNTVLLAIANAGNRGPEAEKMLARMPAAPDLISFSTCILAWKNSPDLPNAVERAHALFEAMKNEGFKPNVITYSTLISIYARQGMAELSETLLAEMERPNIITYTAVIEAWSKSGRPDAVTRVFALLDHMKAKPNATTFNTTIKVIEKCGDERDKLGAVDLVRSMMQRTGCRPNIRTFNAILNVCAADTEKRSLDYALSLLEELRSIPQMIDQIDNYTYPSLFKVLYTKQAPFETVAKVFHTCCEDQAVSRMVVSHMKRCCSNAELQELLQVENVENFDLLRDLPRPWTRRYQRSNVKQRRRRHA